MFRKMIEFEYLENTNKSAADWESEDYSNYEIQIKVLFYQILFFKTYIIHLTLYTINLNMK